MSIEEETKYWNEEWSKRTKGEIISRNRGKFNKIISELWRRPHYAPLWKLDIGCGPAEHAHEMNKIYCNWLYGYYGLELSSRCVKEAYDRYGIEILEEDIYKFNIDKNINFGLFLLLDTFEHIEFPDKLAEKIKELADEKFYIFGNIPLYHSDPSGNGGFEKPMDINNIIEFLSMCGIEKMWHEVYGINGYPYLIWEGKK